MVGVAARVAAVARIAAAGRVAKSGEQLSAVQPLRGGAMASVVSGSGKSSEEQLSAVQPLRGVVAASVVSSSGKSSEVGGATLCSTTAERGGDRERGERRVKRGDGNTLERTTLGR